MPDLTRPARSGRLAARLDRLRRGAAGHEHGGERGAVATVVAILLAGGVLLGFLALVVDVGQLYAERQELQTGADAGALAAAKACAAADPDCGSFSSLQTLVGTYADANASDHASTVVEVCGRLEHVLSTCDPDVGNLTDCVGEIPADGPYVQVRLGTSFNGETLLPPTFAQMLAGNEGYQGTSVGACARASWTPPHSVTVLALTISICEFQSLTGGVFGSEDPLSIVDERRIDFVGGHSACRLDPEAPWSEAGPAGWLDGGGCTVSIPGDGIRSGPLDPTTPPDGCKARLRAAVRGHETIYLAVHDKIQDQSGSRDYHHINLAPFVVTGFHLGPDDGDDEPSALYDPPADPCGGTDRCVSGVFVGPLISTTGLIGGGAVALVG